MRIVHVMDQSPASFYRVICRSFVPGDAPTTTPFGSSMCTLEPHQVSEPHQHYEHELFYLCSGMGEVTSQGETRQVAAGDLVMFEAFADHSIRNTSPTEPLHFLALYWQDIAGIPRRAERDEISASTLIFTAPPTPNGDLHLGHLSGPFSGADIYRRFLELHGVEAFHSCGQDDHQSYVVRKARQERRSPHELADSNAALIQNTLAQADIELANFHKPQESPRHSALTQQAFKKLYDQGLIYAKEVPTTFCKETGAYLYEAHISGTCPHCSAASDGNACEQCGQPNDCADLLNPRSNLGEGGVELRMVPRLFFRLGAFAERLREYHRSIALPSHLAALAATMLEEGLPDICVAHPSGWGIPVPLSEYSDHRIYVWFEMAFGYLASAEEVAVRTGLTDESNGDYWREFYSNPRARVVHFFGFDNGYFHVLLIPAIYMALDSSVQLPHAYVVNELLSLDGSKFSTSRGHLIWGRDLLAEVDSDYVRYYLSVIRPEVEKTDFRLSDFSATVDMQLCGTWQSWISGVIDRCNSGYRGCIPEPGAWSNEQRGYFTRLARTVEEIESSYSPADFSPSRVCSLVGGIIDEAIRFAHQQSYARCLQVASAQARTSMALELLTVKAVAVAISPIMPRFAERLFYDITGERRMVWSDILEFCRAGSIVPSVSPTYFEKIESVLGSSAPSAKAA